MAYGAVIVFSPSFGKLSFASHAQATQGEIVCSVKIRYTNVMLVKSKQQPWTIILLVYVGSIVDLIGLTNTKVPEEGWFGQPKYSTL